MSTTETIETLVIRLAQALGVPEAVIWYQIGLPQPRAKVEHN